MSDLTLGDVLAEFRRQLDWRSPNDKPQGHVIIPRGMAEYLHQRVIALINERDDLRSKVESA